MRGSLVALCGVGQRGATPALQLWDGGVGCFARALDDGGCGGLDAPPPVALYA